MQNLGVQTQSILVFSEVAYGAFEALNTPYRGSLLSLMSHSCSSAVAITNSFFHSLV